MNLTTLTHPDALCLQTRFASRDDAIRALAKRLADLGKINNLDHYLNDVFAREAQGPTALGEGLAVPHGKSEAVQEAAFAVATLSEPVSWEGVDGPEEVNVIVLLAIPPAEAGSTHMQLLTALTRRLADDEVRAAVSAATSPAQLLQALGLPQEKGEEAPIAVDAPVIVCVTACPAGIAHTYMAAEYLEKAGKSSACRCMSKSRVRTALKAG